MRSKSRSNGRPVLHGRVGGGVVPKRRPRLGGLILNRVRCGLGWAVVSCGGLRPVCANWIRLHVNLNLVVGVVHGNRDRVPAAVRSGCQWGVCFRRCLFGRFCTGRFCGRRCADCFLGRGCRSCVVGACSRKRNRERRKEGWYCAESTGLVFIHGFLLSE